MELVKLVLEENALGLVANAASNWRFATRATKLAAFRSWIEQKLADLITSRSEEEKWKAYIQQGFRRGAERALEDLARVRGKSWLKEKIGGIKGGREAFLRESFGRPVSVDRLKGLVSRTFTDIRGTTESIANDMREVLAESLVAGRGIKETTKALEQELDWDEKRLERIARTELIRAHAEGQLTELEHLGVEKVGVMVEWTVTKDNALCPLCASMEGVVFTLGEARDMIPRHPNCRCAWIPAHVGEGRVGNKGSWSRRKVGLNSLFTRNELGLIYHDWWQLNAFCPTGPGGGIDPTCSPKSSASGIRLRIGEIATKRESIGREIERQKKWREEAGKGSAKEKSANSKLARLRGKYRRLLDMEASLAKQAIDKEWQEKPNLEKLKEMTTRLAVRLPLHEIGEAFYGSFEPTPTLRMSRAQVLMDIVSDVTFRLLEAPGYGYEYGVAKLGSVLLAKALGKLLVRKSVKNREVLMAPESSEKMVDDLMEDLERIREIMLEMGLDPSFLLLDRTQIGGYVAKRMLAEED